jgi:hypothetical protein
MKLDALIKFFKHISDREISHGIPFAFRFKSVLSSRKKGSLRMAMYDVGPDIEPAPVRRSRKKAQKSKPDTANPVNHLLQEAQYSFNVNEERTGIPIHGDIHIQSSRLQSMNQEVFYDRGLLSLGLVQSALPVPPTISQTYSTGSPAFALDPALASYSQKLYFQNMNPTTNYYPAITQNLSVAGPLHLPQSNTAPETTAINIMPAEIATSPALSSNHNRRSSRIKLKSLKTKALKETKNSGAKGKRRR